MAKRDIFTVIESGQDMYESMHINIKNILSDIGVRGMLDIRNVYM